MHEVITIRHTFTILFLLLFIYAPKTYAAEFDTILSEAIAEKGIYGGRNGIIFASECENNSMLGIIYVENALFNADIYGSENEITDTLSLELKRKKPCSISISDSNEPLCITITENKQSIHYRLINDKFTATDIKPAKSVPLIKYSGNKLKIEPKTEQVIQLKNSLAEKKAKSLPLREVMLTDKDKADILLLIKACADIYTFNSDEYDIDNLTLSVLYTHRNFALLSNIAPQSNENSTIRMCNESFISDAMYKAFRITPPRPALNMLTETRYCYNNGLYYYIGGYDNYFATDVKEIIKSYAIGENEIYVIFKNTYTDKTTPLSEEYSSATFRKDDTGYYLSSLCMGKLTDNLHSLTSPDTVSKTPDALIKHLPLIIALLAFATICVVIYFFLLK